MSYTARKRLAEIDDELAKLSPQLGQAAAAESLLSNTLLRQILDGQRQACLEGFERLATSDKYVESNAYEKLALKLRAVDELHGEFRVLVQRGKAAQEQVEQLNRQKATLREQFAEDVAA